MKQWGPECPDERAVQSLDSGLGSVFAGCKKDFVSGLIDRSLWGEFNSGREVIARDFVNATQCELPVFLRCVEERQLQKHGTYSRRPGYFIKDDLGVSMAGLIDRYYEGHCWDVNNASALHAADSAVLALYNPSDGLLNPATLRRAVYSFEGRTGFGWPVFSSDRKHLEQVREMSARIVRAGYPDSAVHLYPAVVGYRGQPRGPGKFCKFRAIYQCSRVIGNLEKMIQIPLHEVLKRNSCFAAWVSTSEVSKAMTRLINRSKEPLISIDFGNFDASIPPELIQRVFGLIEKWFHGQWHPHIRFLAKVFCGCGIIIPSMRSRREIRAGELRKGGVPSGSVLTNLIDSLVNLWVLTYSTVATRGKLRSALIQGDDAVLSVVGTNIEKISATVSKCFGMSLSVEKSHVSNTEAHFLQNVYNSAYRKDGVVVGVRPLNRVLNGMMSYEDINRRWDDKELYDAVRWLQQLNNASEHPAFRQACKWLLQRAPGIERFMAGVISNDVGLIARIKDALSGKHEWGKVAVEGLATSEVFRVICELWHERCHPSK